MWTTRKRYFLHIGLVLFGCFIALALAEGFVRVFYPDSRDHVFPGLLEIDHNLGWRLQAGESALHHSTYFAVTYSINARGYRDKAREPSKPVDVYRILLYGDSQVFGWGIPADQRFSNVIENQLPSLEIWNLAVVGYGLDQEILAYEENGQSFQADEVIFFASKPILSRTHHDYIYKKYKPKFVMEQNGNLRVIPIPQEAYTLTRFLYNVFGFLYLPHFVERRQMMPEDAPQNSDVAQRSESREEGVTITQLEKSLLERARNVALERKHRLTVLAALPDMAKKDLQLFCEQKGLHFLAIELNEDDSEFLLGRYDRHWNIRAHQLIVSQLLPYFRKAQPAALAAPAPY